MKGAPLALNSGQIKGFSKLINFFRIKNHFIICFQGKRPIIYNEAMKYLKVISMLNTWVCYYFAL